jgi:predicted RNA-binding Zn-ribbon protein involved in translation (DUF1610 family)
MLGISVLGASALALLGAITAFRIDSPEALGIAVWVGVVPVAVLLRRVVRFHCPHCGRLFYWYDTIAGATGFNPLRRSCHHCGARLPNAGDRP